jgi:hypothetical protein
MIQLFILLASFNGIAFAAANCKSYVGLQDFKSTPVPEREALSALNQYRLRTRKQFGTGLTYKGYAHKDLWAAEYKVKEKPEITLVFRQTGQLIAAIEGAKVVYCGSRE